MDLVDALSLHSHIRRPTNRPCFGDLMGGKKKKSAAQAAAPVAPATATAAATAAAACRTGAAGAGNSVSEEPKKQPASNKPTKPAKENKSKGGINR